ncbi:hypothetical protein LINGRAHAP2_LOCUS1619, partial [Linum grandiflorum]
LSSIELIHFFIKLFSSHYTLQLAELIHDGNKFQKVTDYQFQSRRIQK